WKESERCIRQERPEEKADAEGGADDGHASRPAAGACAVGNGGLGRTQGGSGDPGTDPGHKKERDRLDVFALGALNGGDTKKRVKDDRTRQADQQNRPAAERVADSPPNRGEKELHQRKRGKQEAQYDIFVESQTALQSRRSDVGFQCQEFLA